MKCRFCQQEMELVSHTPVDSLNTVEIHVWQCYTHAPVLFRIAVTDRYLYEDRGIIIIPIKDKWYAVALNHEGDDQFLIEEVEQDKSSPVNFYSKRFVAMVPSTWIIDPDNAIDKLKTYLVFM